MMWANLDDTVPQGDPRSDRSVDDRTCLVPKEKRKKSSSGPSQRKRQRVEADKSEKEKQQVPKTTAEEGQQKPCESRWFCPVSSDDELSEGQTQTHSDPNESQSHHRDSRNEQHKVRILRGANLNDTAPNCDQRSDSSVDHRTCLIPKGKRKKSSSGPSQRKRHRVEVDKTEEEEQQDLTTTADGEEGQQTPCESWWFASLSSDDDSSEGQTQTKSEPKESQSHHRDSRNELNERILREELDRKYVQQDRLGEGGFGTVYAGYRRDDLLPVAIKHIPKNTVKHTTVILDGEEKDYPLEVVLLSMVGEGEAVTGQTRGISVALLDWCELQDELVIVMERPVPCKDLWHYINDTGGFLLEEEAKVIMRQLVEGMINIHSKKVLHRDIKPDNILVLTDPEGLHIRVLDFGCGDFLQEYPYTRYCGTTVYSPPEWHLQRSYQAEPCTVWQIGVVLFYMLAGVLPFNNPTEIISEEPDVPHLLTQECDDLLRSCLDKQPQSRPSLHDMLHHPWLQTIQSRSIFTLHLHTSYPFSYNLPGNFVSPHGVQRIIVTE
ncbi:hypothetical protein AOLI_G00016650 [Acnodon oligacanthus]